MATYPNSILVKGNVTNEVDVVDENDHNILKNEIIAQQTYIGTVPQGSRATMVERMSYVISTDGSIFQTSGGFPAETFEGRLVWRTDLITAFIHGNGAWNSLGQSLSNTIFAWNGHSHVNGTGIGVYNGNLLAPTVVSTNNLFVIMDGSSLFRTCFTSKFRKISGISSAILYAKGWVDSGAGSATTIRLSIGSATGTAITTVGTVTPNWTSNTISLSGLTNGTVYDLVVDASSSGANAGYIDSVVVVGI